ncbi:unnamed protein product [Diatraea saccharalis]|uniref:Homeobox domain-containing protein n=1 Tax=Diatraea saccharalis TaxID=40085 RepID=A0A9N9RCD5_9NEOP|nr:unnamed protein product [Diatraea saccharalis]
MCACRQKKSFLIEDILQDSTKKKPYKNLTHEHTEPLICNTKFETPKNVPEKARNATDDKVTKFNVTYEVQREVQLNKVNVENRRNTYPLYPTPMKVSVPWSPYKTKDPVVYPMEHRPPFSYYSEPLLNTEQMLRNQLAANRFVSHPFTIRQTYGLDRVSGSCCGPWWSIGGRRKGGQVRFSAAQTGALERRFNASKYLSPDERRGLASTLRLSDRQVKTWFQNRRAKWRRTAPDSADPGSPPTADEGSDEEVHITDE